MSGVKLAAVCRTDTYFCSDKSVTAVVVKVSWYSVSAALLACQGQLGRLLPVLQQLHTCCKPVCSIPADLIACPRDQGLAAHKDELGAPLCPCRHYDDKKAEVAQGFWNCPCVPMRERKVGC